MSSRNFFGNGHYQLVLLALAVQQCGGESVEAALFGKAGRRVQPQRITVEATARFAKRHLSEEGFRVIVGPGDKGQVLAFSENLKCFEPSFKFLVGLNVRIVEKTVYGEIFAAQGRNRIDGTRAAANMEQDS
jgi:hypothetical protein